MNITVLLLISFMGVILVLVLCIFYLLFQYRKLLEKYTDLNLDEVKSEAKKRINLDATSFFNNKIDQTISNALDQTVNIITKAGDNVANNMKRKTLEKLKANQIAEDQAVSSEFDEAREEINKYKADKFEEIRKNANQILVEVTRETLSGLVDKEKQDKLIIKALENAKTSGLF